VSPQHLSEKNRDMFYGNALINRWGGKKHCHLPRSVLKP
jgi:hypothetical protein